MKYSKELWMRKENLSFEPGFTAIFVPPTSMRSMVTARRYRLGTNEIELRLTRIFGLT